MVHVLLMFLSEWRDFPSAPCLAGGKRKKKEKRKKRRKKKAAHVSMLLKSRASPDMRLFGLCNKKRLAIRHMNGPVLSKELSIPSYDIGNYFGLGTYQHSIVKFPIPESQTYRLCCHTGVLLYRVCFHTECAFIQSVISYRLCSHAAYALI